MMLSLVLFDWNDAMLIMYFNTSNLTIDNPLYCFMSVEDRGWVEQL